MVSCFPLSEGAGLGVMSPVRGAHGTPEPGGTEVELYVEGFLG